MTELIIKRQTRKRSFQKKPYKIYHNGNIVPLNNYILFGEGNKYDVVFHFDLKKYDKLTIDFGEGYGLDRRERHRGTDFNNRYLC